MMTIRGYDQKMKTKIPHADLIRVLSTSPVLIVAARSGERVNLCTVAWATALDTAPPKGILVLASGQATTKAALAAGVLSLNIPTAGMVDTVNGIGRTSSRSVDKLKRFGLTIRSGPETGAALINETVAEIECRVLERDSDLGRSMRSAYDLIPVELIAGYADPIHFHKGWRISSGVQLLHHLGGEWFVSTGDLKKAR